MAEAGTALVDDGIALLVDGAAVVGVVPRVVVPRAGLLPMENDDGAVGTVKVGTPVVAPVVVDAGVVAGQAIGSVN